MPKKFVTILRRRNVLISFNAEKTRSLAAVDITILTSPKIINGIDQASPTQGANGTHCGSPHVRRIWPYAYAVCRV